VVRNTGIVPSAQFGQLPQAAHAGSQAAQACGRLGYEARRLVPPATLQY